MTPEDFFRRNMVLEALSFRPDISLYRSKPDSRLAAFIALQGRPDDPPYWAYAWAGGAALAVYLRDHPEAVADKAIFDFGTGSGLVGIAAAKAGARKVWTLEPDPIGRAAVRINAEANGVLLAEWNEPGLPDVDIVLAGDVFYDATVAEITLPILVAAAEAGKTVLVGDPFRRDLPLDHLDLIAEYSVPDMGGGAPVRAGIFALRPGNIGNAP